MFNILPYELQCIIVVYLDYCEDKSIVTTVIGCDSSNIKLLKYWHDNSKHKILTFKNRKEYRINGKLHRENGPAIEYPDGSYHWYKNGKCHREDGPAIEEITYGVKSWFINDELHRENGPAIENFDGSYRWYKHGKLHRENGPAIEWKNGRKDWLINNLLHREDGPAIEELSYGHSKYYIYGKQCSFLYYYSVFYLPKLLRNLSK